MANNRITWPASTWCTILVESRKVLHGLIFAIPEAVLLYTKIICHMAEKLKHQISTNKVQRWSLRSYQYSRESFHSPWRSPSGIQVGIVSVIATGNDWSRLSTIRGVLPGKVGPSSPEIAYSECLVPM